MSWISKRFYSKLYFLTTMPHGRSLNFFFFFAPYVSFLASIYSYIQFMQPIFVEHLVCASYSYKAHVITTVKKRDKYSCPCRNYILSYCGVYRTFYLWFGVIITKHCVIMIWEKVRFLYMGFIPFDLIWK